MKNLNSFHVNCTSSLFCLQREAESTQYLLTYPAVCGDNVLSGCPTLGLSSRRSQTPERCCAASSHWSETGGLSMCGHTHLERTHPWSVFLFHHHLQAKCRKQGCTPDSASQTLMEVSNEPLTTNTPSNCQSRTTAKVLTHNPSKNRNDIYSPTTLLDTPC